MHIFDHNGYAEKVTAQWEESWEHNGGVPGIYLTYTCGAFIELQLSPEEFADIVQSAPNEVKQAIKRRMK